MQYGNNNNSTYSGTSYSNTSGSSLDDNLGGVAGDGKDDWDKPTWFPSAASSIESKFSSNVFPNGPMAASFEKYVHNIFRPGNRLPKLPTAPGNSVSAHSMLRVQDLLGSAALDESADEDIMKAPLEKMFSEQGLTGIEDFSSYSYFPMKSGSNYSSSNYNTSAYSTLPSPFEIKIQDNYAMYRRKADEEWKRNNRQMIIDYKGSDSAPLTPYMYLDHPYVRSQDSRIVGSNFVQITSRPKDSFLEKIERTLAEVRAMPRY